MEHEERMAVFIDYDNLALGAREHLGGMEFDFGPIADALAVRGRVLTRRAYADWSFFDEDRRRLTRHQVQLIEMTQRMGASRKNAADIKMVVDAIEMAFERDYITTYVMCTGDSDFSPLVAKLRELNKRVIGVGIEKSTSKLLPPACDEFLFYDRLEGVDPHVPDRPGSKTTGRKRPSASGGKGGAASSRANSADLAGSAGSAPKRTPAAIEPDDDIVVVEPVTMEVQVAQTLADLVASTSGAVTASMLRRSLVRKDSTFSEGDYGFRTFGEFVRYLADRGIVEISDRTPGSDPTVALPALADTTEAFGLLREAVMTGGGSVPLSGLKNRVRKARPEFSEKPLGFRGFLQFCRAAETAGVVSLAWDDAVDGYLVSAK
jgi:uncharacterized LabA/DUF88 family protein